MRISVLVGVLFVIHLRTIEGCSSPPGISNGGRSYPNTNAYSTATYYCNTGYYGSGDSTISCGFWGSWDSLNYNCYQINCGTPPSVSNAGRSYSSTTYGSRVTYSCNTGYTASGTNYITCYNHGSWPTPSYYCTIKNCGTPPSVSYAGRSYSSTTYGSRVTYTCNTGYYGSGTNYITCQSNAYWSSVSYTCTIRNCGTPPTLSNGYRSYSATTYNNRATYYCNTGYTGSGTNYITCQSNGVWSSVSYTCTIKNCGTPPSVTYASRSYSSTTYGSRVTYSCNAGYTASGTNYIDCPSSGTWPSTSYTCTPKDCGNPVGLSNGYRTYPATTYNNRATYYCNTGYYGTGTNYITCQSNAAWSSLGYYCTIKNCGTPPTLSNGTRSYSSTTYGSRVTYSCSAGYYGSGTNYIDCPSSGTWPTPSYTCPPKDCSTPPTVANSGRSYTTTTYTSTVTYTCNTGYTPSGSNSITCPTSGAWPTPSYVCTIKNCGTPPSVSHATPSYTTTTYNSRVTYSCNTGYSASGTTYITCSSSGTWPTPTYVCTIKDCGVPNTISNGYRTYTTTTYQSTVTYFCNTGYEGSGSNSIMCQGTGTWSTVGYTCTIISCGNPPSISNGSPSYTTTTWLSTATYSCNMGYLGTTDPTITCEANKQWSHTFSCVLAQDVELTKTGYGYLSAAAYGITGYDRNEIVMDLQGLDVFIGIGRNNYKETNMYQIVYLWSNQAWTYFRIVEQGSNVASHEETGHVVDFTMKKRFYITWDSNTVKTGRIQNGVRTEFISYYHSSPYDKNYILFSCWATNTATVTFIVDCGTPATVANAEYVSGYTTYKATLTWACKAGYIPSGDGTITCESSAEWTTPTLVCTPKDCGEPLLIEKAQGSSGPTVYPNTNTYSCFPYHTGSGTDTINCQTTGVWSSTAFSCSFPANDILTQNYNFAGMSTYGIFPTIQAYLVFEIKGCTYAVLAISSSDSSRADMFEITLNGNSNEAYVNQAGNTLDTETLPNLLDCNTYVKFYLRWSTNEISLGKISGSDYDHLVGCDPSGYSLNYILMSSWNGYSVRWNLDEGPDILVGVRDAYHYHSLSPWGLGASDRSNIVFQVKGCNDAFIGISSVDSSTTNMYELVIGSDSNTKTRFRLQAGGSTVREASSPSILDCNNWRTFYLSWSGSEILFGRVTDLSTMTYSTVLSYTHSSPYSKNYLLVSGYSSSSHLFKFILDCGPPPTVGNSTVTASSTVYKATTSYQCIVGWTPAGSDTVTCQSNGAWSALTYNCTIVDCHAPPTITYSTINTGLTTYASSRVYSCITGYENIGGTDTVTCQASGAWTSTTFFCKIKDCGTPASIVDGVISPGITTYSENRTYSCNIGYYSIGGPATIMCEATGLWTVSNFTCLIKDCETPAYVEFSTVSAGPTVYLSVKNYSCFLGYENIGGTPTIECEASGNWSYTDFFCRIKDCKTPKEIDHASVENGTTTYRSVLNYTCDTGYFQVNGTETIECLHTGNWSETTMGCQIKDCGVPEPVDHGNITTGLTTYESNLTHFCDIGYYSEGNETIECLHTGNWSYTDFVCIIVDCFEPRFTENCDIDYINTTYLSVVNYTCHIGYLPQEGPDSIYCQANGNWTESTFWCKIIDCGPPDEIEHATHNNGTTTFWKNITYTCDIGYVPHGEENITCQLTGNWTETDYNCPPYDCLEPLDLKDSTKEAPNTTFMHVTNYTCDLGHYDSDPGNMSITCTPIGWENITFWCIPVDCYPPTFELPRAEVSYDTTIFRTINSSEAQYTCDIGYTIDPEELADGIVVCNYTGLWQEVEFVCIFNYCKNISKSFKAPATYPLQRDGMRGQMYFLNDTMFTVDCCGVIAGWEFKPVATGFVHLMIWRRDTSNTPVLVGYNTVLIANTTSIVNVTITDDEKIAVQAFDQIGWYSPKDSPIAFDECSPFDDPNCPQATLHYDGVEVLPYNYKFDWDNMGNPLPNRSYAIKYYFTRNTPLQFMQEEYNISIPDHTLGDQPVMTFSIVGVDHAEKATYTLEPLGDTPQTIYFYIDSYFGTVKVQHKLPNSNETDTFVYNVTAVDGCENYAYTILTVNTYNAPPKFENLPNQIEIDETTGGFQRLYDIVVYDPTNDPVCCTLEKTIPTTENFNLYINGTRARVETTKNAYFSASFVNSYFVRICCQDRNYSTMAILQVKVKGDVSEEAIPFPDWFYMSLVVSSVPIFILLFSSCTLMLYLTFCF